VTMLEVENCDSAVRRRWERKTAKRKPATPGRGKERLLFDTMASRSLRGVESELGILERRRSRYCREREDAHLPDWNLEILQHLESLEGAGAEAADVVAARG
jgi:hypothetical protein